MEFKKKGKVICFFGSLLTAKLFPSTPQQCGIVTLAPSLSLTDRDDIFP